MKTPEEHNKIGLFWAKTFAQGITDAVVIVDQEGLVQWFNQPAKNFFQLSSAQLMQDVTEVFEFPALSTYLQQKNMSTFELPLPKTPDQMLSVVLIPYDQHFLLITQDAGFRHHIERMRQDFVANVSHEMRTPLTVIRGYLELMQPDVAGHLSEWLPYFEQMQQQMMRIEWLIEDLLLLSKVQSHQVQKGELETLAIAPMLIEIIESAKTLGTDKHHFVLDIDETLSLQGNEKEINSCLSNLIINAVRYSPNGGPITIAWYQDKHGKHFYVKDEGLGIEQKHIPRLTERFYRVDKGRSPATGGAGLGLAIVKHVLIRHKASLSIQSELGKGSIFRCDFPN
ncbi:phosphate regulon sensor histidine kinase PhoR [Cysteiniphilum halobium]|uniref:phosphate regulon sensor histidine kinase PhoR n=1 Tax=Cysteiniphilum halobium TaxID=2219059 RepID=UPI000E64EB2E|nr:phosphate regulon sensor histidine kinase PhoR [Cysteiniphilum halobium]